MGQISYSATFYMVTFSFNKLLCLYNCCTIIKKGKKKEKIPYIWSWPLRRRVRKVGDVPWF